MADSENNSNRLSILNVLQSILAAAIGVQSEKNRQRDFKYGKPIYFIFAGLILFVVFIVMIITIVSLVIPQASQG